MDKPDTQEDRFYRIAGNENRRVVHDRTGEFSPLWFDTPRYAENGLVVLNTLVDSINAPPAVEQELVDKINTDIELLEKAYDHYNGHAMGEAAQELRARITLFSDCIKALQSPVQEDCEFCADNYNKCEDALVAKEKAEDALAQGVVISRDDAERAVMLMAASANGNESEENKLARRRIVAILEEEQ